MCKVRIYAGAIGTYTIYYGTESIEVAIDYEEPYIKGPTEVYPYDYYTYKAEGTFSLTSNIARIVEQDGSKCVVEVLTGKKGEFTLYCTPEGEETQELLVTVNSLWGGKDEELIGIVQ